MFLVLCAVMISVETTIIEDVYYQISVNLNEVVCKLSGTFQCISYGLSTIVVKLLRLCSRVGFNTYTSDLAQNHKCLKF
jgi:hypothetical protein